jgi:hypothetical protein
MKKAACKRDTVKPGRGPEVPHHSLTNRTGDKGTRTLWCEAHLSQLVHSLQVCVCLLLGNNFISYVWSTCYELPYRSRDVQQDRNEIRAEALSGNLRISEASRL